MLEITLEQQIECVKDEIKQRKRVYARLVSNCQMTQATMDKRIAEMQAVLATLTDLSLKSGLFAAQN